MRRPVNGQIERAWSLAERIAYYSKPNPLSGYHIWHGPLKWGYDRLVCQKRQGTRSTRTGSPGR